MTTRFSDESLATIYDAGHTNLPWDVPRPTGFLAGIDFAQVLAQDNARDIIQAMPVQPLLYAIRQKGLADSLEVLPHLSADQVERIFDYDCWQGDRLIPSKAFEWLLAFREHGSAEMYQRFADLDEEYQIAILAGRIQVYELEDYEGLPQEVQDRLTAMPCNTVYYEIISDTPGEQEAIQTLIESTIENNMRYAYALLSYPAYAPPNEDEGQIAQFRKARLEEDGFVPVTEAAVLFQTIALDELTAKYGRVESSSQQLKAVDDQTPFLDVVLTAAYEQGWDMDQQFEVHQSLLWVANCLCSVSHLEVSDVQGLNRLLEQVRALVGFGLDYLAQGDLACALKILQAEKAKVLFRVAITLIEQVRSSIFQQLLATFPEKARPLQYLLTSRRYGALLLGFDKAFAGVISLEMLEVLRGLYNRYPMRPKALQADQESTAQRIMFTPIASYESFSQLVHYLNGMSAWLYLARQSQAHTMPELDKSMTTTLVWGLVEDSFTFKPLTSEVLAAFKNLNATQLQQKMDTLQVQLATQLVGAKDAWLMGGDAADVSKGVEYCMYFMKDHLVSLMMALKSITQDFSSVVMMAAK